MLTEDYQLHTIRRRFAERGYQPLNQRREQDATPIHHWIGIALIILAALVIITPIIVLTVI
jgi:hypothetical protein